MLNLKAGKALRTAASRHSNNARSLDKELGPGTLNLIFLLTFNLAGIVSWQDFHGFLRHCNMDPVISSLLKSQLMSITI